MNGDNDLYLYDSQGNIQPTFAQEGGVFKEAMQYMNKAYRMDLIDPEMFTQKNEDFVAKFSNLQYLSAPSIWWNGEAVKTMLAQGVKDGGFYIIPGSSPVTWDNYGSVIAGGLMDRVMTVSKNSKYPERAMEFINFLYSEEGVLLLRNGVEGKHWVMEDGMPEFTEETLQAMKVDPQFVQKTGITAYQNIAGLSGDSRTEQGAYLDLRYNEKTMKFNVSEADIDFNSHYDVSYPGQAFVRAEEAGLTEIRYFDTTWQGLMPDLTNDMKMIQGKITNYVMPFIAKLIMSKDEAEFEANWDKGTSDISAMGYTELYQWIQEANVEALQSLSELQ